MNISKKTNAITTISFLLFLFASMIPAAKAQSCPGICQDINNAPCANTYLVGLCPGGSNIMCCPTSGAQNPGAGGGGNASGATSPQDQTVKSQTIKLPNPLGTTQTIPDLIGKIVDWLILIASIAILPFMIIWGAYQLLMAGSKPEKVIEGRHTITWAVVGYGLLLLSKSIELIIQSVLKR